MAMESSGQASVRNAEAYRSSDVTRGQERSSSSHGRGYRSSAESSRVSEDEKICTSMEYWLKCKVRQNAQMHLKLHVLLVAGDVSETKGPHGQFGGPGSQRSRSRAGE